MQVDHLESSEHVRLSVRPMAVNTNYHVTFQAKATLTIYDVFPIKNADTGNAHISTLVVDNGKITVYF